MNIYQIQKRKRFHRVADVLAAHPEAVDTLPALKKDAAVFAEALKEIDAVAQSQLILSEPKTIAKSRARAEMADLVLAVAARVAAYAEASDDPELAREAAVTRSSLMYGRAANAQLLANQVLDLAARHQEELEEDYQLTAEALEELTVAISHFEILQEAPAQAIDTRGVATRGLDEAIEKAGRILSGRLKRHVTVIRAQQPGFAAAFDQASVLEKRPGRRSRRAASQPLASSAPLLPAAVKETAPVAAAPTNGSHGSNGNGSRLPVEEPVLAR